VHATNNVLIENQPLLMKAVASSAIARQWKGLGNNLSKHEMEDLADKHTYIQMGHNCWG